MKFQVGKLVMTRGALDTIPPDELATFIARHIRGDWGDLGEDDKQANEIALDPNDPQRLFSAYNSSTGKKIYVITEWDRSATTACLSTEY